MPELTNSEKQLKRCLDESVKVIKETITKLQPSNISESDVDSINSIVNNMNTFTLNVEDDEAMDELKSKIERVLNSRLPHLSADFRNYVKSFLSQYDYDDQREQFKNSLSVGILYPLCRGLQGLSESIDAFNAAWDGKVSAVQQFIQNYPSLKNKPGHFGTTLLYSAARNGHLKLVEYLVETAKCSVNAQNVQDLGHHLETLKSASHDYEFRSIFASTALHAACFNKRKEIVEYLVKHGADYFIQNQALETPIANIRDDQITQYFRDYLLLGYLKPRKDLPNKPILEETRPIVDCVWEYKSLGDVEWQEFSSEESKELQKSLIVASDQQFQTEIRLTKSDEIYTISMVQFLQSGQNSDDNNNNLDWVRCRGSSILNFDCYCIWQIMIIEHPNAESDAVPSLKIFNIPSDEDITSQLHIHSWYNCDAKTNACIDKAMNNRQRLLRLNLDFITDRTLLFNLQTFTFSDDKLKVRGFIRWIPKLISNTEQDKNKIKILDNFTPMTNLIPIPLTTKRLEQVQQESGDNNDELPDDENVEETTLTGFVNDLDDDGASKSTDSGVYTLTDFEKDDTETSSSKDEGEEDPTESADVQIDEFLGPNAENFEPAVSTKEIDSEEVKKECEEKIKNDLEELKTLRNKEKQRLQQIEAMDQLQENLDTAIGRVHTLNAQLEEIKRKKEYIQQVTASIQTIQYTKIEKDIMHNFLTSKHGLILEQLQSHTTDLDEYFINKIPRMTFHEKQNSFTVTLTGIQVHHRAFRELLQRILILAKAKQRAIEFYQRHLNRITRSINRLLFQVTPNTKYWKHYSKIFYGLLKAENAQYMVKFNEFIAPKIQEIGDTIITDSSVSPWTAVRRVTDSMMKQYPFENEIERLKQEAFEKFIELNVSVQQLKFGKIPTEKSRNMIQYFIEKMKTRFREDPQYAGYDIQHLCLIPPVLQQMMIYYCCFAIQLPLFESAEELLKNIKKHTVITISTSTGSGKSTLLPALLVADGYDKVLVTQPRRLPCKLISKRVNETMVTDRNPFAAKLAGWAVSGDEDNARGKILYLTDGLLKERLLNDENFITRETTTRKSIVLFIDEVHERSANIDLCLALIARMLKKKPSLIPKVKVIISSATLDESVPKIFAEIPNVKLKKFEIPLKNTLYPIKDIPRPNENILDVVKEILAKRDRRDQVLCFVSSTAEAYRCCRLLNELSQNTIVAYPLVQAQSPHEQEEVLERGSIFFSTTVAETSLTFPSLKYVVDTGKINVSTYNIESHQSVLREDQAARYSTETLFN